MNKKGNFGNLANLPMIAIVLVVFAITVGLGVTVLDQMAGVTGLGTGAVNVLGNASESIGDLGDTWLSPIVIVVIAVVIIGLLFGAIAYFGGRNR